jgi:hypothetical protein
MHTKMNTGVVIAIACLAAYSAAQAEALPGQGTWQNTLQARDLDGNRANGAEAWYDTTLGITWLANANAAAGTPYDTDSILRKTTGTDGRMLLADALMWAGDLSVGGVTGWRLPDVKPIDGVAFKYTDNIDFYSGTRDESLNVSSRQSELGHMFHVTLGNLSSHTTAGERRSFGDYGLRNTGPFSGLQPGQYWTDVWYRREPARQEGVWNFDMSIGFQHGVPYDFTLYGWAVHDGDVGAAMPVPEPQTWALLLAGLAAVAGAAARRRRR